ncbi:MAG TPA: DUF502 domain-containing protein [Candidatus Polarisedimenticolia bacterium]|nr:DUF502 domain-containing protein [Candidatus Polarisedimenticolia bacterium]
MGRLVAWLRGTFIRGMLLILPLAITYVILRWLFHLVTGVSTPVVDRLIARAAGERAAAPLLQYFSPLIALFITIGVVLLAGVVGGNYLGGRLWAFLEELLLKVPLVRWFYGSAREMIEAFRLSGSGAFSEVVLVEYPRRGMWALGFVTSPATGLIPGRGDDECVYVFLPTTPNPTSGYTIVLPRSEAPKAAMTVDEGLKLIVSGGFIAPRMPAQNPRVMGDGGEETRK